jgi:hypothetical protein
MPFSHRHTMEIDTKILSPVPGIIVDKGIKFYDISGDSNKEIKLCEEIILFDFDNNPRVYYFVEDCPKPFFKFDTLSDKTLRPERLEFIDNGELEKSDMVIYSMIANPKWYEKQKVMYVIGSKSLPPPASKKVVPKEIKIQKDIANNRVRLLGKNAGPAHFDAEGGCGPWVTLPSTKQRDSKINI